MTVPRKLIASFVAVLFLVASSFIFADTLSTNDTARELISTFGYFGVVVIAFIANINVFVPVPPGIFAPIFTAAGMSLATIIIFISIGTLLADAVGYMIGNLSQEAVKKHYPQTQAWFQNLFTNHQKLLIPVVTVYAAIVPLPNEAVVIPLGMLNYPAQKLILPITLGTIVHHSLVVFGTTNIFNVLF